jgi:hypothetical protein
VYKKPQNSDAIAAFMSKGGQVQACPATEAQAKSLKNLARKAEEQAARGERVNVLTRNPWSQLDRETRAQLASEIIAELQMEEAAAMAASGQRCVGFDEHGHAVGYDG